MTLDELVSVVKTGNSRIASEDELLALEQLIGAQLPSDYRAFLERIGGAEVGWMIADFRDEEGRDEDIAHLLGIDEVREQFENPDWRPVPESLISIATDAGGNPIMLCLRADRYGEIFLIDHEVASFEADSEPLEDSEEYGLAFRISPSFEQFVACLSIENE